MSIGNGLYGKKKKRKGKIGNKRKKIVRLYKKSWKKMRKDFEWQINQG